MYPGNMTFYKYHGRQRQQDANLLFERDVVFSTYATLASEPDRGIGVLNSVEWFRIVLDEGGKTRSVPCFPDISPPPSADFRDDIHL